jgi:hypothetical protein
MKEYLEKKMQEYQELYRVTTFNLHRLEAVMEFIKEIQSADLQENQDPGFHTRERDDIRSD